MREVTHSEWWQRASESSANMSSSYKIEPTIKQLPHQWQLLCFPEWCYIGALRQIINGPQVLDSAIQHSCEAARVSASHVILKPGSYSRLLDVESVHCDLPHILAEDILQQAALPFFVCLTPSAMTMMMPYRDQFLSSSDPLNATTENSLLLPSCVKWAVLLSWVTG